MELIALSASDTISSHYTADLLHHQLHTLSYSSTLSSAHFTQRGCICRSLKVPKNPPIADIQGHTMELYHFHQGGCFCLYLCLLHLDFDDILQMLQLGFGQGRIHSDQIQIEFETLFFFSTFFEIARQGIVTLFCQFLCM